MNGLVGEAARRSADEVLIEFTHAVRASGVAVTPDRARQFLAAASILGLTRDGVRCAARATLCRGPADLARLEDAFALYFRADLGLAPADRESVRETPGVALADDARSGDDRADEEELATRATDAEVLRRRDIAVLSDAERVHVERMLESLQPRPPRRRRSRRRPHRRGDVDAARTARASLRLMGEPVPLRRRARVDKPRPIVLLVDVSGSMAPYADMLLRLAHVITCRVPGPVETFTFGTRVTRVTTELHASDGDHALAAVTRAVPDWSGGTRLGENLGAFLARWGRLGRTRGAVVVFFSDGWESGDAGLLAAEAGRLRRLSHKVLWVNPHRGKPGYEPIQQGIVAVLPHVDALLAGHSAKTFKAVLDEIARA